MTEEKNFTPSEIMQAVDEVKASVKALKDNPESGEHKERLEQAELVLEAQETKNQELVTKIAEQKKLQDELEITVKALELSLARGIKGGTVDHKEMPEFKALQKYVQFGERGLEADERTCLLESAKALRTDIDTDGGYLTTTEFDDMIIKKITEISNVRSVARVRTITEKSLTIPTRTGIPTVTHEGETEATSDSQSAYGSEQLIPYRLSTSVPYTLDLLQTSRFNLENEIMGDVTEAFGKQMGEDYVKGTGVKMSEGFTVNAAVVAAAITSEASGAISAKDLTDLTGELKVGYNPMYGFNRKSLAAFRSLEDGAGRPIWQINLRDAAPNTINGEPYVILQDMDDIAADSLSVVYADFMRGYTITDRAGMVIIRDEYALKKQAMVEMTFHRWTKGQVVLAEAFSLLKTKS